MDARVVSPSARWLTSMQSKHHTNSEGAAKVIVRSFKSTERIGSIDKRVFVLEQQNSTSSDSSSTQRKKRVSN